MIQIQYSTVNVQVRVTSDQRILTKGRIAVLSPLAAANGVVRPDLDPI